MPFLSFGYYTVIRTRVKSFKGRVIDILGHPSKKIHCAPLGLESETDCSLDYCKGPKELIADGW